MDVQVCDFRSESFNKDLLNSILNTGFAVITNHGIPANLIEMAQDDWRLFFLSAQEYKKSLENDVDPNMGYKGFQSEKAVGFDKPDLKEFYHWKPGQKCPNETFSVNRALFYSLQDLGMVVLKALDDHMMDRMRVPYAFKECGFRQACIDSDNTILRTLYYPALNAIPTGEDGIQDAVRAAAHEDINFITLLVAASAPGLEVQDKAGNWHAVPHEENSITVNIGDMLQLMSEGLYKSTTHRVVNAGDPDSDRISMPLFIHPNSETVLAQGITAKQFLAERIAKIYGAK